MNEIKLTAGQLRLLTHVKVDAATASTAQGDKRMLVIELTLAPTSADGPPETLRLAATLKGAMQLGEAVAAAAVKVSAELAPPPGQKPH